MSHGTCDMLTRGDGQANVTVSLRIITPFLSLEQKRVFSSKQKAFRVDNCCTMSHQTAQVEMPCFDLIRFTL